MARTMAREAAFMLIFEREFGGGQEDTLHTMIAKQLEYRINKEDASYIDALLRGTQDKQSDLDDKIQHSAKNWSLDRISRVELAILRLALYEMYQMPDIPVSVSINEAVELTKKYAGEEATSFVHGILRDQAGIAEKENAQ